MDILTTRVTLRLFFLMGAALVFDLGFGGQAFAQLSPGDLSAPHAAFEGLENCSKCHDYGQKLSSEKCLACHSEIKERVAAGLGLHAHTEYRQCENCHVEHQGKDYDLVWWKDGPEKFDHGLSGFKLDGKHTAVKCRGCHNPGKIVAREKLTERKKDLVKTYLGLGRVCRNCHQDEHRGQLKGECSSCHVTAGWKPASGFDHNKTAFALTGKHTAVTCDKCHQTIVDNRSEKDPDYLKFAGLKFGLCSDCHKDAHNNKFGGACANCHSASGWKNVNQAQFDHARTSFPLEGRHAAVACDKCHAPGKPLKGLKFAACRDCHKDYHQGQFAARTGGGACEECHTVAGYSPSKFTLAQHNNGKYPLTGAHLAVACINCHRKTTGPDGAMLTQIQFASTRCQDCHKDPHRGQVDRFVTAQGCEHCHKTDGWQTTNFDHTQTKFTLEGKHLAAPCRACHRPLDPENKALQFTKLETRCQDCHKDIHRGQFAGIAAQAAECGRCHTPGSWKPEKFDHARDAAFKLDGAHLKAACGGCHKKIADGENSYILFKPLNSACKSCHSGKDTLGGGGQS